MFEQGRGGGKRSGDGADGGLGLRRGRVQGCVVFEGEQGAEAAGEGDGFGGEGLAEGGYLLVGGGGKMGGFGVGG